VAKKYDIAGMNVIPRTPIATEELVKWHEEATKQDTKLYQEMVGSALYTAILIRPDVAFATAKLLQFLMNPGPKHLRAIKRVLRYLFLMKETALQYGNYNELQLVRIASDSSFADGLETRRLTQGYLFMLFGGPVIWKAIRQPSVTTSSTEAEIVALQATAKELIGMKRFFEEIRLSLGVPWEIFCDNQQTIRLVVNEGARIQTQLRYVDIQNM
jgi:hypothetical protein